MRWSVVIPAYNADASLERLIARIGAFIPPGNVLVVDDGSQDRTAEVAEDAGAKLLKRIQNGGKGRALRDGFGQLAGSDADWVLCIDADGQHDPEVIPAFQQAAETGHYDLIIGNRLQDLTGMPLTRRFSNRFSSLLVSLRTGEKLPDVQCGYRAIKADLLERLNLQSEAYDIEVEMILKAWRLGGRIGWVRVPTIYRGERSFLKKFPETIRFIKAFVKS
jgi:glycosyltransferase involved in cell wall biosynthesis